MTLYFETYYRQLNKWGEELCGDHVQVTRRPEQTIITLADGLGSGVKANILSTFTTRIATCMLREGVVFDEVITTLAATLPVCRQRGVAYSTITIFQAKPSGECYLAEFDSSDSILLRQGVAVPFCREERSIGGKTIRESNFTLLEGDTMFFLSDGVVHAGVGVNLNMGWRLANVISYVANLARKNYSLRAMVSALAGTCHHLYAGKPGDDATIVGMRATLPKHLVLLTGPPQDAAQDNYVVDRLMKSDALKVVSGGTTAQIVARRLGVKLSTDIDTMKVNLPPLASMPGVDLVTEGMLTLTAVLALVRTFALSLDDVAESQMLKNTDAASRLAKLLIHDCTHVLLMVGCTVNTAHLEQLPQHLGLRRHLVTDLAQCLRQLGKEVTMEYY